MWPCPVVSNLRHVVVGVVSFRKNVIEFPLDFIVRPDIVVFHEVYPAREL